MTSRRHRLEVYEKIEEIGQGHLVRFETGSRSPKSEYLVLHAPAPREVQYANPDALEGMDTTAMLLSERDAVYLLAGDKKWPGPDAENWFYRFAGGDRLGDRTRLVGLEITGALEDPHRFLEHHMAEAWPHI